MSKIKTETIYAFAIVFTVIALISLVDNFLTRPSSETIHPGVDDPEFINKVLEEQSLDRANKLRK